MGDRVSYPYREDEQDVDFSDTRLFALQRWDYAVLEAKQAQSNADQKEINEPRDWISVQTSIRAKAADPQSLPVVKRLLTQIIPFPRSLANLVGRFTSSLHPHEADDTVLWGLADLNITLSISSPEKLNRTVSLVKRLRNVIELFNRCLSVCEDMNEPRYAMIEVLECLLQIQADLARYLRKCPTDAEATKSWKALEIRINENITQMDSATKHLNDINSYSQLNQERRLNNLTLRHAPVIFPEENATFPLTMIPRIRNESFYGREEELRRLDDFLGEPGLANLRTYTIYGRRGIGKTDIALEYGYRNPSQFDAIFWIQCETSVSLRQSFTDMAVALKIPGADRDGHHEENQLAVLKWLKTTQRKWLLIFDNAERETILRGYWPIGAKGRILITSRKYYNFTNDAQRKGDTIKPFTKDQSWALLMRLLGDEWVDADRKGSIKVTEEKAARALLDQLGGLALAIEQAAVLINNDAIGGPNIVSTYESFKEHQKSLPPRQGGSRTDTIHALDSLWNMRFTHLSRHGLALLSVLSLLSPDGILIDLFLPKNQKVLDGKLAFCKQSSGHVDPDSQVFLSSVITAPPLLRTPLDELISSKLIKQEGREFYAHRVVQEAMNYHSQDDLQEYFDSAVALVYEAFPKQIYGDYLSSQWSTCEKYISHGAHLSFQFYNLTRGGDSDLKGNSNFINLISNCAWYLYEISDYELCLRLVETASIACKNKETLKYANLCNVAGGAYYELNQLSECRKNWETFYEIQDTKLQDNALERSSSCHNMGNLETACDNLDQAAEYFDRAIAMRIAGGDKAANVLANSYLCMSRVYFLRGEYEAALNMVGQSEALIFRISGADAHFMAHVHYAYGNIDFAQRRWDAAKRAYEASLRIGLASTPIHPITAAAYYSLGCVEYERKNNENAKAYLDKAMAIAQLRSPNRDDGTMARIMWKTSVVLESDTYGAFADEATKLRIRADLAMKSLSAKGEGGVVLSLDENGNADAGEMEDVYDSLVPGYFR